ncbi:glycosyltransferase family 2 protein [Vibrio parahaemolyticus]|uniref:glycosyltransferase n=1 Tax=Vibrio parahaemolyticus TaxID=670 RepID=UPI00084B56D3|nr:glycosyltransferase [Vibrio parahaemolyticus]ELB2858866.1 glycosyltransferase family 2 protein [Vibrio parahaemolyticus]OEB51250.1 N-acetylglucosaminyltransferase [Vibrio parahaemolyticus]
MLQDSLVLLDYLRGMLLHNEELWLLLFPVMIIIELPLYLLVLTGIFRWSYMREEPELKRFPSVSFVITCYGEGEAIGITIDTLVEQIYPGHIEILAVVDGAVQNQDTYKAALNGERRHTGVRNRKVRVLPKWQRGGRVSTLNAGLSMASGGALRVRNHNANLLTKMQSLEYMLSMQAGKTGMATWGVLNNISGAFGAFRKNLLKQVGGWDTHTAEDLDLTMRLKQYKRRYPDNKLAFSTHSIGHTDVPDTLKGLVLQRLRWDGDLLFLFLRKHNEGLSPRLLGWGNFVFTLAYGVIQNVLLPLLVVIFSVYMVIVYPLKFVLALMLMLYFVYLFLSALIFVVYIGLVSERKKEDLKSAKWLFLYPVYQFFMRLITAFSMVNEVVRRSHEESSMAPWWVLKRGKKF